AIRPPAGDLLEDEPVENGDLTPIVARLDVGDVDLDRRQPGDIERVGDRPTVVGPGAGVDHHRVAEAGEPVRVLDKLPLAVGLEEGRLEPELPRPAPDPALEVVERDAAVDIGVAAVEDIEVHPVQDGNAVVGACQISNSSTADRTLAGSM